MTRAICYSGYRTGQSPVTEVFPSYDQVKEDLLLLAPHYQLLRMYDCGPHAQTALEVIRREALDLRVMLGVPLAAELNNPHCPWGGVYPEPELKKNRKLNDEFVELAIDVARRFPHLVYAVSAGNEATVDWNDHLVSVDRVIEIVRKLKASLPMPVTFCENYVPWQNKLQLLVPEVNFISLHTYPVWEQKRVDEALAYTIENYQSVARLYPDKPVVITEAGWTTRSNGRGIAPQLANAANQQNYVNQLLAWADSRNIVTFLFEAFDEPWKGSDDPDEPEKHWGLFTVDRQPKNVLDSNGKLQ